MKEVTLNWRGRDILVKYKCINHLGLIYAVVIDKNGKEWRLNRNVIEGIVVWQGGISFNWPQDMVELLSDFLETQPTENVYGYDAYKKPDAD